MVLHGFSGHRLPELAAFVPWLHERHHVLQFDFRGHGESDPGFHPWPIEGSHRPTFCVWELGAVAHERVAWSAYLSSARDEESRRAYLRDTFEGAV